AQSVSKPVAEQVFRRIDGFAEFGFPKAHADAFGLLAYQTAWLRTYYPAESLCALFNAQPMGFYTPHVLVNDGKRHGVQVLPPDINLSGANCNVEEMGNKKGEKGHSVNGSRQKDQRQLALALPVEQDMVQLRPMSDWNKMRADYIILGMSPNVHPLSFLRPRLHEGIASTAMVESFEDGKPIEVAGLVVCRQRPETASGFIFMVIEDEFGLVNVVVKPDVYEAHRTLVRGEPFVIIRGELQRRDGVVNLIAHSFVPLTAGGLSPAAHNFGTGHGGRH